MTTMRRRQNEQRPLLRQRRQQRQLHTTRMMMASNSRVARRREGLQRCRLRRHQHQNQYPRKDQRSLRDLSKRNPSNQLRERRNCQLRQPIQNLQTRESDGDQRAYLPTVDS
jgi:hypothetical protein